MSDTVKLVIDFPKDKYKDFVACYCGNLNCDWLYKRVAEGIPLDDVKADIQRTITASWYNGENYKKNYRDGLDDALVIIDKHMRGET